MESKKVIKRPIISEKSLLAATAGRYTFQVDHAASKGDVRRALKEIFGVNTTEIKTMITKGRTSRVWGRKSRASVGPIKKAVVSLEKGQKLDIFESKGS